MKMKRTWKKILLGVFATVMFVSLFTFVDMGWNVREVHAGENTVSFGAGEFKSQLHEDATIGLGTRKNPNSISLQKNGVTITLTSNASSGNTFYLSQYSGSDFYMFFGRNTGITISATVNGQPVSGLTIKNGTNNCQLTLSGSGPWNITATNENDAKILMDGPNGKISSSVSVFDVEYHTCSGTKVSGTDVDAKCNAYGYKAAYKCSCGKYYENSNCTTIISNYSYWHDTIGLGKIKLKEHKDVYNSHDATARTITYKCSEGCDRKTTYTLVPNDCYDEIAYIDREEYKGASVTIDGSASATATVYYKGTGDTTYNESTTKPKETGTYEAYITMGLGTVSSPFSIAPCGDIYKFDKGTADCDTTMDDQLVLESEWEENVTQLIPNAFSKTGYSFDKWESDSTIDNYKYFDNKAFVRHPVLSSPWRLTLTAQWTPNDYTVTFDNCGADINDGTTSATVTFDATPYKITIPKKNCSEFQGYYTAADDSGKQIFDKDGKAVSTWKIPNDTTLYAHWDIKHDWGYEAKDNEIIATCKNETCKYSQKLTLNAEDSTYDKNSSYSGASITNQTDFPKKMETTDVWYKGTNSVGVTYAKSETAPKDAGTYTASVTVSYGGVDYTATSDFTINKAAQSATAKVDDYNWGETTDLPTPSCDNLEEQSQASPEYYYNSVDSTEGGKKWNTLTDKTVLDAGTYYVYAVLKETNNYKSGTTATSSFKVQGLTIDTDIIIKQSPGDGSGVEYDKKPKTADIKVEGEGVNPEDYTITYATSPDGPFTEEKPTFTDAGEHKIYYRVKRFGYEVASGDVDVKINRKAITISNVKAKDKVYDGNTTASFDYSEVVYAGIIKGDTLSVTAKGTFSDKIVGENKTVTITTDDYELGGTSKDNYVLAESGHQDSAAANITQREVTLAWDPTSFAYDGNAKKPTATVANLVSGDNCDVTVELVDVSEAINAGNYKAKAAELTGTDSSNYILPSDTEKSFTINKIDQPTVTVAMDNYEYSADSVPTPSVSGGAKENPSITYYFSLENKKTGGTEWKNVAPKSIEPDIYYMYAVLAETTNYKAYTTEPVQFIVDGSDMTSEVSVSDINANNEVIYTYTGKKEHGIKVNIPEDAKVMYGTTDGNYTLSECPTYKDVNAEGYTIYYKVTRTGYNPVKGSAKVVINKAPLTVTPESGQTKVYQDDDPTFTYTVSGLLGSDTASVVSGSLERENGEDVTNTGYELSGNNLTADNYAITCTSGVKFMITPRNITEDMVTLVQKKFGHTGYPINVAENGNVKVKYNWIDLPAKDYEIGGNIETAKGTYFVTITGKHNYQGSVQKEWRITDAIVPVSIEDPEIEITYGSEPTIPITDLKGTDEVKYGTKEDEIEDPTINLKNAGKYKIWIKVIRDGFEPYEGSVIITIKPKVLDIIWGETSLVYNGKIQAPAATVKAESLLEGDSCEVETSSDKKDVGSGYIATAIELTGENSSNYKLPSPLPTTEFKITPKSLTLKARNVSKYVGSKDPVLTYDAVGICSGDTLSGVSVARDPGESVGSYQIRVSVDPAADNKNYTITMQSGVLVIKNHESNDEGSNGNSDGGSNGGGNNSGNTIPVIPVQKPVVLPIDSLTANAANKNTKNTAGNNKGANLGADGTNAETDDLSGANGAGNLTLHLEVSEHSPIETASIETPVTKLLEGSDVFTTEEALAIKGGVDARVWVHIDKLDMSVVPDSVHDEILSAAKGLEDDNVELLYFDISLFKQIGDGEIVNIHEPGTHIDITLELPESVINTDDKVVREYKILRLHDGVIDVIPTTYNPDTQTISFATDKFSTYVLAYIDKSAEEITEAENTDSITVNEVEKENSSTAIYIILFILLILAIAIIIFILYRRKKNEDTI